MDIPSSNGNYFQELRRADVIRTGTADQHSARTQHFQGTKIQFFIASKCGLQGPLAFGKGRRIEHNTVVLPSGMGVISKQVESVGFNPLDLAPVQGSIPFGYFQCQPGTVHSPDAGAALSQMESEGALVTEHIQRFTPCILGRSGIVFSLVEECSGFLALERLMMKSDSVHGEDRAAFLALD